MPKINDFEMIKRIMQKDDRVYILILSVHKESGYLKNSINIGADEVILKPIKIDKFLFL